MKKHLLIATLILSMFSFTLKAQIWAPSGAEWYYEASLFMDNAYIHIQYVKDTIIQDSAKYAQGIECQVLRKTRYYSHSSGIQNHVLGHEYTYATEDKVFIYRNNMFYTLYNFAANVGDEWEVPYSYDVGPDCAEGRVRVVSKGDTLINGETLRYIQLEPINGYSWGIYGLVIEKIGPVQHYMLPEQNCIMDLFEGQNLRCYSDYEMSFSTGTVSDCDYLDIDDVQKQQLFAIQPNPANTHININNTHAGQLSIYALNGQLLKQIPLSAQQKVDISGLSIGAYILQWQDAINQQTQRAKLLKY